MTDTIYASKKSTEHFIDENPSDVVFVRSARIRTSAGGYKDGPPALLPPQRVRLVAQSGYLADQRVGAEGDVSVPRFVVVGLPEVDMKKGDTFVHGDETFRISKVNTSPPWAVRGDAIEHG